MKKLKNDLEFDEIMQLRNCIKDAVDESVLEQFDRVIYKLKHSRDVFRDIVINNMDSSLSPLEEVLNERQKKD